MSDASVNVGGQVVWILDDDDQPTQVRVTFYSRDDLCRVKDVRTGVGRFVREIDFLTEDEVLALYHARVAYRVAAEILDSARKSALSELMEWERREDHSEVTSLLASARELRSAEEMEIKARERVNECVNKLRNRLEAKR